MSGCHVPFECHCKCHVNRVDHCENCLAIQNIYRAIETLNTKVNATQHHLGVIENWYHCLERDQTIPNLSSRLMALEQYTQYLRHSIDETKESIVQVEITSKLPSIAQLNKITFDELEKVSKFMAENGKAAEELLGAGKILVVGQSNPNLNGIYERPKQEHPSRQHLEKCLHEKNLRIKSLEEEIQRCKNEINGAIINDRMSRSENTKLKRQVESLLDQLKSYGTANAGAINKCCPDAPHVGGCNDRQKTNY
jgi:hypothetical protein